METMNNGKETLYGEPSWSFAIDTLILIPITEQYIFLIVHADFLASTQVEQHQENTLL